MKPIIDDLTGHEKPQECPTCGGSGEYQLHFRDVCVNCGNVQDGTSIEESGCDICGTREYESERDYETQEANTNNDKFRRGEL